MGKRDRPARDNRPSGLLAMEIKGDGRCIAMVIRGPNNRFDRIYDLQLPSPQLGISLFECGNASHGDRGRVPLHFESESRRLNARLARHTSSGLDVPQPLRVSSRSGRARQCGRQPATLTTRTPFRQSPDTRKSARVQAVTHRCSLRRLLRSVSRLPTLLGLLRRFVESCLSLPAFYRR